MCGIFGIVGDPVPAAIVRRWELAIARFIVDGAAA